MRILGRRWLQIFASGLVLLYLVERTSIELVSLLIVLLSLILLIRRVREARSATGEGRVA